MNRLLAEEYEEWNVESIKTRSLKLATALTQGLAGSV